jgi:hypothetical protein
MIQIYLKMIAYCPKEEKEINGNKCLNCKHFQGISVNDFEEGNPMLFFRCFYKKEAEARNEE